MDRRQFLALTGASLALAACQAKPVGTPAVREKAVIGLTYIPNVQFSPFYLAMDNQDFTKRGLDAELRHHGANEGLFDALVAGKEDFVLAGGDELLQARAGGADLVAVASYYRSYPGEVIARADAGITTTAELRGKRIGIPGRYGESWFGLLVALQGAGLKPGDVEIVEIGYTAQAAMAGRKVDAIIGFANNDAVQLKLAGTSITQIPLAGSIPLVSACLITTRATVADRPVAVRQAVAGMLAGIRAAVQSPANAVAATGARVPNQDATAQQAARATMDATVALLAATDGSVDGRLNEGEWDVMGEFMFAQGLIPTAVRGSESMTNQFVDA